MHIAIVSFAYIPTALSIKNQRILYTSSSGIHKAKKVLE